MSLLRRRFRTVLTVGSFAVAMGRFGLLAIVQLAFNQGVEIAGADRLCIVMNKTSFIQPLPLSYMDRLKAVPGVKDVTHSTWFGGIYQDERNFFPQFAIDVDTWRMYKENGHPRRRVEHLRERPPGAVAGQGLADRFGWKVGDRIPIKGAIFPGTWQFNLDAIYKGTRQADDTSQFWFHYDYLNEAIDPQAPGKTSPAGTSCA